MNSKNTFFRTVTLLFLFAFSVSLFAQAPAAPTLSSPANGSTGISQNPTLTWNAVSGATSYTLQIAYENAFYYNVVDVDVNTTSYNVTGLYLGTTYYWRVSATNGSGTSAWSSVWNFQITTVYGGGGGGSGTPAAPTLISPYNGATNVSTSPSFSWTASTGATSYGLQVATDAAFTSIVVNQTGLTTTSYNASGLSTSTQYYWRVNATNSSGTSSWASAYSFTTEASATPPGTPTLASPSNGATGVSNHPTLYWHPASGANTYRLQVSTDSSFSSIDFDFSGITDTSYHIHTWPSDYLDLNTTYYWRVSATNTHGTSSYSTKWNFTTKTYPDAPSLVSPSNGATDIYLTPTLKWTREFAATAYTVYFALDSNFTTGLDSATVTDPDTTFTFSTPLTLNTTYYWKVRSNSGVDNSGFSAFWSFTTVTYNTWYVRTSGSDTNGGLTPSDAFLTIQKAINSASPGDKIDVGSGTFTEDLSISTNDLEIYGIGYSSTTTIKGVAVEPAANLPLATPNIDIQADDIVIHDFRIESPDVAGGSYSSGIVFAGQNLELYNNEFRSVATSDSNVVQPYGYCIVLQSWSTANIPSADISGLNIHNNKFTYSDYSGADAGVASYEGIWLNPHTGSGTISITDNKFTGNVYRGIATLVGNATISGNTISSNVNTPNRGVWLLDGDDISVSNNKINGFTKGIEVGTNGTGVALTGNTITGNSYGVIVSADYTGIPDTPVPLTVNNNSIYNNNTFGLDVSGATGGGTGNFIYLDATNNYWGSSSGPKDTTYITSESELPGGSGDPIEQWVNKVDESTSNPLGNQVVDNDAAIASNGFFVEYYPWNGGSPSITIDSDSSVTGATVSLAVRLSAFGASFNTLQGSFTYDASKLDFLSSSYGTGTLVNISGWIIAFSENVPGTITFAGVGFTPISTSGVLFKLNFQIIDQSGSGGSTNVTGSNANFLADGNPIFGGSGSFSGTITYSYQQYTYLRGDVTLDGQVTIDDALMIDQYLSNLVSFSQLQKDNADADLDGNIDADDISAVLFYVLNGYWSSYAPPAAPQSGIQFADVSYGAHNMVDFPIMINNAENVTSLELIMNFDQNAMDYQTFSQLILSNGTYVDVTKLSDGVAKFTYATSSPLDGNIVPGKVVLRLKNAGYNGEPIKTYYKVNGGELQVGPTYNFGVTDVKDNKEVPAKFSLSQNYPNPFNPTTTISYTLPEASYVSVKIYDMLGREVRTLVSSEKGAGEYRATWNGDDNYGNKVASGTYIYRVVASDFVAVKKMVLLK